MDTKHRPPLATSGAKSGFPAAATGAAIAAESATTTTTSSFPDSTFVGVNEHLPWIEKYRPASLDGIQHQENVVLSLRAALHSDITHLLLHGPPGSGKTSTSLAMCRQMYGNSQTEWVLELNASVERGIDVIRTKIKKFCQQVVPQHAPTKWTSSKMVILDEADSLTPDAQNGLLRIMELFAHTTRFCLLCNSLARLKDALISRCARFRFEPLPRLVLANHIQDIAARERLRFDSTETLCLLVDSARGDMRRCISFLHGCSFLVEPNADPSAVTAATATSPASSSSATSVITTPIVNVVSGQLSTVEMETLMAAIWCNDVLRMQSIAQETISLGFPTSQILVQLIPLVLTHASWTECQKAKICLRIADADKKLADGADNFLQLLDVLSFASTAASTE